MLAGGQRDKAIAEQALGSLTAEELLAGAVRSPELTSLIIAWNPELITTVAFWSAPAITSQAAFAMLSDRPDLASLALTAMISLRLR